MALARDEAKVDEMNVTICDLSEEAQLSQVEKRALLDPNLRTAEVADG